MKKVVLLCLALCAIFSAQAQDFPYSKYINYSKEDFKANNFKYHKKTNTWSISKTNGLVTTVNILAILVGGYEDIRPASNDYTIAVQMGENDKVAEVIVYFYKDDTYHKLLTFMKEKGQNLIETASGKLVKHKATYKSCALELNMEQHFISRTSSRTADWRTVKNVDESYNEYEFTITTDVTPTSKYLSKQAAKKAKREAKGRKKDLNDMM